MDDSARLPVVVAGLDSYLDHRSRGRGRMDSGVAGGTNQYRGGGAERMRGLANFRFRMADWIAVLAIGRVAADWQIATPGWAYDFPGDHHAHDEFKTEWWYFTGNLTNDRGRRFGYELTFFRQGIRPPAERVGTTSRFIVDDLKFAHFTITDAAAKRFLFHQKVSRGSFGDAGFGDGKRLTWIDSWNLKMNPDGSFDLAADALDVAIQLHLVAQKPPVIHGSEGISRKAQGAGHAPLLLDHAFGASGHGAEDVLRSPARLVRSRMGDQPACTGAGRLIDLGAVRDGPT